MSEGMVAYKRIRHPAALTGAQLDAFLALGWYRMNQTIFTVTHSFIHELRDFRPVWWLRFPVQDLLVRDAHRRMRKRNASFRVELLSNYQPHPTHELLYNRYLESVPFDGYSSIHDALYYDGDESIYNTYALQIWDRERLVGMGIFDTGKKSGSSILHFYDPEYARFSLGKYLILLTMDELRARGCSWYYPGYVVTDVPRFDYKLFLGRDVAEYFDPGSQTWKPWNDDVLRSVSYTEEEWSAYFSDFFI
jgi:arginine-tRNA-protein transferase